VFVGDSALQERALFAPFPRKIGHFLRLPETALFGQGNVTLTTLPLLRLKNLILLRNVNSETWKIRMHDTLVAS